MTSSRERPGAAEDDQRLPDAMNCEFASRTDQAASKGPVRCDRIKLIDGHCRHFRLNFKDIRRAAPGRAARERAANRIAPTAMDQRRARRRQGIHHLDRQTATIVQTNWKPDRSRGAAKRLTLISVPGSTGDGRGKVDHRLGLPAKAIENRGRPKLSR
jgi:hypothetical protein